MTRTLVGTVISNKMQKTVVVSVERKFRHAKYQKVIIRNKKYKVHNEEKNINVGDMVEMKETRPLSSEKRFTITKKISE